MTRVGGGGINLAINTDVTNRHQSVMVTKVMLRGLTLVV